MTVCVEKKISDQIDLFLKNNQELTKSLQIVKNENVSINISDSRIDNRKPRFVFIGLCPII